ncbi:MAG TPA: hypothetical protein VFN72_09125 [Solirubrobacterales bacterium]|jgi:hypothetical protein|nr:hypothetical protein [Solirubrobacterales bacterium]
MRGRRSSLLAIAFAASLLGGALTASGAGALTLASQTYQLSGADTKQRLTVRCPGKKALPYSGGMVTDPLGPNGEGVYPHSYERLGVQRGWHVTPVLYSPTLQRSLSRSVTLQVVCGPRLGPVSSPHNTGFVSPGETETVTATCPKGNRLLGGGFQRTNFVTRGGNYVTESRAASDRSWQVSGGAFGNFGGELTAIAYCLKAGSALVSEVDSETALPMNESATTTTPACPGGSSMVGGGFSTSPTGSALVSSAYFDPSGGWSATAFNEFGPTATLTAHAYCMTNAMIKRRAKMRHGTRAQHERTIKAPKILDSALKVAISERVSNNGCFPSPGGLVGALQANKIQARQAANPRAVGGGGSVVNVLTDLASCERVRLAVRQHGSVIVLDSATGAVTKRR